MLDGASLALVHEWNSPELVSALGRRRRALRGLRLLFHDTRHRSFTDPDAMALFDLEDFDGVLACGSAVRDRYLSRGWTGRAWTWNEAADLSLFRPRAAEPPSRDLVWIGNGGGEARRTDLRDFLAAPVRDLGLAADVFVARLEAASRAELVAAGVTVHGWIPDYRVAARYARHRVTLHLPRRLYRKEVPGIPTIRVYEALACGIPLVSLPWDDVDGLFRSGTDYLEARTPADVAACLFMLLHDPALSAELSRNGSERVRERHGCAHRVDELLRIYSSLTLQAKLSRPEAGVKAAPQPRR